MMTHGNGNFKTRYAHLQSSQVSDGLPYSRGRQIALSDTDHTCAHHLHFEVRLADPPSQLPQPIDPAPLLPTGNFPDDYAAGLQFEVTVDGHVADLEDSGPNFTFVHQFSAQALASLLDSGQGAHRLELLLVSPKLGVHSLHVWNISEGFTLSVSKSGGGTGTIGSVPNGINCGTGCNSQTATFAGNSSVQLSASAASGSTFAGWGGDCASAGTSTIAQVTLSGNKTCTATFQSPAVAVAVRLNPFGNQTGVGPYNVEVVDRNLNLTSAPKDITVTVLREVISQCSGLLFSSNRTVVVSQGQSSAAFNFNAGHDPACNTVPITTNYTITGAILAPNQSLDLSVVPSQQRSLSVTR